MGTRIILPLVLIVTSQITSIFIVDHATPGGCEHAHAAFEQDGPTGSVKLELGLWRAYDRMFRGRGNDDSNGSVYHVAPLPGSLS